jgi:hypothetical protein
MKLIGVILLIWGALINSLATVLAGRLTLTSSLDIMFVILLGYLFKSSYRKPSLRMNLILSFVILKLSH